jgi:hypoxanthine phosphoribosyltransferase
MKKIHYTDKQISSMIHDIIRQMNTDNWKPDYVVGITRGGLYPALMISHYLNIPMHTLKVSMRDDDHCESNLWMAADAFGHEQEKKNILIVDDINDSGATLDWVKHDWESGCFPNSDKWLNVWNANVKFATIVDNEDSKFGDVDYTAVSINKFEEPNWIVFPWEEWWKN